MRTVKPKPQVKTKAQIKTKSVIKPVKIISTPIATKQNESQIIKAVAEETGLKVADIKGVFASLNSLLSRHMKKRGSGEFKFPKLGVKVRRIKKPATKARMGRNPATGEEIKIAAKPARSVIKASVLKSLKEMMDQ
jgi:nucleoid DNA-binding protein